MLKSSPHLRSLWSLDASDAVRSHFPPLPLVADIPFLPIGPLLPLVPLFPGCPPGPLVPLASSLAGESDRSLQNGLVVNRNFV